MGNTTDKKNIVVYRKLDRMLICLIKFESAHIKQLVGTPEYEYIITERDDIFVPFNNLVYVSRNIGEEMTLGELLQ